MELLNVNRQTYLPFHWNPQIGVLFYTFNNREAEKYILLCPSRFPVCRGLVF